MTETLTDVSGLVDSAFDELECLCNENAVPHDGGRVAYYSSHAGKPCIEGWLCAGHLGFYVNSYRPSLMERVAEAGGVQCMECGYVCYSVDDFCKVVTL